MAALPAGEEELLVPVPTTRRRLRERGFNQAQVLCSLLAGTWGMPMEEALVREDDRTAQSTLGGQSRRANLTGCMRALTSVSGRRVLLVDDFLANGEAASGAARLLEQAGAQVAAIGIVVEKSFQPGRKLLTDKGYRVISLARVSAMGETHIAFLAADR